MQADCIAKIKAAADQWRQVAHEARDVAHRLDRLTRAGLTQTVFQHETGLAQEQYQKANQTIKGAIEATIDAANNCLE